jgi:hypothetical protein
LLSWYATGSYFASRLIASIGVHKTIHTGLYLGLIAVLMLWATFFFFPNSILAICSSLSLFLLGFGILFPSMASSSLNLFKDLRTQASSILGLISISSAYIGSFSAEWADESRLVGLALYVLICSVLALGIYQRRDRGMIL